MSKANLPLDVFMNWKMRTFHGFESRRVSTNGTELHYLIREGSREKSPIVLVHGIGACAAQFDAVLASLAKAGHTVLAPDLAGHGFSGVPASGLSSHTVFDTFAELLSSIAPEPFYLVGNSLGGGMSLRFAQAHPERLRGLILASPAGGFVSRQDWEEFRKNLIFETRADAERFLEKLFHKKPWFLSLIARHILRAMNKEGLRDLIEKTDYTYFEEVRDLRTLKAPTLLIWGRSERLFSPHHLEWFRTNLPSHVTIEEPERIGHCPQHDDPSWFAKRVLDFISVTQAQPQDPR